MAIVLRRETIAILDEFLTLTITILDEFIYLWQFLDACFGLTIFDHF